MPCKTQVFKSGQGYRAGERRSPYNGYHYKISTRQGTLMAELVPTPKIIAGLREWFPKALLVGWKYEVEGDRAGALQLAQRQIAECKTNACVANGPAYGAGFGLVRAGGASEHLAGTAALFEALEGLLKS